MSKVAARQPGGRERIRAEVLSNVPQAVGKSSALIAALTERKLGSPLGYDMSWIIRNLSELGLGTRPRGEVRKGPMTRSRSAGW
jgi:hypothetical protein